MVTEWAHRRKRLLALAGAALECGADPAETVDGATICGDETERG